MADMWNMHLLGWDRFGPVHQLDAVPQITEEKRTMGLADECFEADSDTFWQAWDNWYKWHRGEDSRDPHWSNFVNHLDGPIIRTSLATMKFTERAIRRMNVLAGPHWQTYLKAMELRQKETTRCEPHRNTQLQ